MYPERIKSKRQFYNLYLKGLLGNRVQQYTYDSWIEEVYRNRKDPQYKGLYYATRDKASAMSSFSVMNMTPSKCYSYVERCLKAGLVRRQDINISTNIPPEYTVLHGELARTERGLYLHYSTAKKYLRDAFREESRVAINSAANSVLRYACDPSTVSDIDSFLDRYPDSVVEFTAYTRNVGDLPGRNAIIWEVRNY